MIFAYRDAMRRKTATDASRAIHRGQIAQWEAQLCSRGVAPPTDEEFGAYLAQRFGGRRRRRSYTALAAGQDDLMRALEQSTAAQVKG